MPLVNAEFYLTDKNDNPISGSTVLRVWDPGTKDVSGSVRVFTQGPQAVSGTVAVYTHGAQAVTGSQLTGSTFAGSPVVIGGTDSETYVRSVAVDSSGRLLTVAASANSDKGFSDGKAVLAATTVVPIRATTYTEQSTDAQRSLVSTSANDDVSGTGARTVKLTYYDQNCNGPYTETVIMDGTVAVNTVASNICYIEKMEVQTVGSNASNVGTINLKATTGGGGATIWSIAIGDNKTFGCHHYVAAGKTAFVTGMTAGIKGADTTSAFLRAVPIPVGSNAEIQISDLLRVPQSGHTNRAYATPIEVSGSARITAFAAPDSTSSRTYYASFDFYEE